MSHRIIGKVIEIADKDNEGKPLVTKGGVSVGTPYSRVVLAQKYKDELGDVVIGRRVVPVFHESELGLCREAQKEDCKVDLPDRQSGSSSEFTAEAA